MMKVAVYARYSTDRQSESSIDDQLRICREYADRQGWSVAEEYADEAISGAALGNRPAAQRMINATLNGEFQVILVADLTRLSRNQGDLAKLTERFRFQRIRVIGVQDGYDSNSRTARMQAGMSGIMSEEFRAQIGSRTYTALQSLAKAKRAAGGRAYGYSSTREPVEAEAKIVREVFSRHAAGESMKAIASDLNARGVPSPGAAWKRETRRADGRWLVSSIHTLLHNELYLGRVIWNRREWRKDPDSGLRTYRERPRSEWIVHEDPSLVLIHADIWARSHERLGTRGGGQKGPSRYLLSGLLDCGVCGAKFIVYGGSQHRYICGSYHAGGEHACNNRITVPRDLAEELILEPVVNDLLSPAAIEAAAEAQRAEARREQIHAAVPADVERINVEIAELERLVQAGILSSVRAAPSIEAAERDRRALMKAAVRQSTGSSFTTNELIDAYREEATRMRHVLQGSDVNAARSALREVVGTVKLMPRETYLEAHFQRGSFALIGKTGTYGMVDTSESCPRYQLYIYLLLLEKFFVAQDERAFEASICDVRSQDEPSFS